MSPCTVSGSAQLFGRVALAPAMPHELLGVERVPAGPLERARRCIVGVEQPSARAARARVCAVSSSESGDSESVRRVRLAAAPARPPREQLRPGRADDEQRHAARPVGEVVDEVEQRRRRPSAGPRRRARAAAARRAPRGSAARPRTPRSRRSRAGCRRRLEPDERPQVALDPRHVRRRRRRAPRRVSRSFSPPPARVVGLEDARLRLDHLAERPEASRPRRTGANGPAASRSARRRARRRWKSSQTSRLLPMPGTPTSVTSCGSRSRRTRSSASARSVELALAPDERRAPDLAHVDAEARPSPRSASQTRTGSALPLASTGAASRVLDRALGRAVRRLVDEDAVHRRGRLQPRRRVDDVARGHALARLRPRIERDERLAGRDRRSGPRASPSSASAHSRIASAARTARSGSSSCATGAPKSAMTASPMNFSTVPPKRSSSARTRAWYGREQRAHVLRVEPLGVRGGADEVAEEHGHDLALLAGHRRFAVQGQRTHRRSGSPRDSPARNSGTSPWAQRTAATCPSRGSPSRRRGSSR